MSEDRPHLLVVDDDTRLRDLLRRFLCDNGFRVSAAADATEARAHLAVLSFDLLIVDVMMPGESGLDFVAGLRASQDGDHTPPVLMLTALGETQDRIRGLESGADDYLPKPFEPRELLLRLRSILRRTSIEAAAPPPQATPPALSQVRLGPCTFDLHRHELSVAGQRQHLTAAEAALLACLARHPGEIVSREDLAAATGLSGGPRAVDVQITRLRKKVEDDPRQPRYLHTVRGQGYVLRPS